MIIFSILRYCDPVEESINLGVNSTGVVTPTHCPAGYYCPLNTVSKHSHPCPTGTFSNTTNLETDGQCTPCTAGYYCGSVGLTQPTDMCDAGYVCVNGSDNATPTDGTTGYVCLPGYYCNRGSGQGTKCPLGTFSNTPGLHNVSSCEDCTPGMYCNVEGMFYSSLSLSHSYKHSIFAIKHLWAHTDTCTYSLLHNNTYCYLISYINRD